MPGIEVLVRRFRRSRLGFVLVFWASVAVSAGAAPRIVAAPTPPSAAAQPAPAPVPATRIIAVGDVHGDLPAFKAVLAQAGLIDAAGGWTGGDAVLVQLGDVIDRGPSMRSAFDFLMALEQSAAKAGGRVVPLLGNHEVMDIAGDLRYVAAASYAEFADAQSEKRREDAWRQVLDLQKRRAGKPGQPAPAADAAARDAWMQAHPPGYLERAEAFGPTGVYGRWLRGHSAVFALEGTAFVHGGIAPSFAGTPLADIDRRVHDDLARFDADRARFVADGLILPFFDLQETFQALREELQSPDTVDAERRKAYETYLDWSSWTMNSADGPLWFRGYGAWTDAEGEAEVPRLLAAFHLTRLVVAHTPQPDGRIRVRFGGSVFLIDTGMNTAFFKTGRGSALEIAGNTVSAIYPGEPARVIWPAAAKAADAAPSRRDRVFRGPDGTPLPFADDPAVLDFLRDAKVVKAEAVAEGITHVRRLTLEKDGVRVHAVFRKVNAEDAMDALGRNRKPPERDYYGFEPAAYRLGLLLGVDCIPPATLRRVEGEPGSVQIWIENSRTEQARRQEKIEPPERIDWQRHLQTRMAWDVLIGNTDRNQGNTLYGPDWRMWFIDHTRAFRPGDDLRGAEDIVWCERDFWRHLHEVGDSAITASVQEDLRPAEVAGLLGRRRKLVDFLDARIRERGEQAVLFDWTP
jgi:hypothetical protein